MGEQTIELVIGEGGIAEYNMNIQGILESIKAVPDEFSQFHLTIMTKEGIPIFKKMITKPQLFSVVNQPVMYDERTDISEYSSFGFSRYVLNDELIIQSTGIIGKRLLLTLRWSE